MIFGRKTLDQILGGFTALQQELIDHVNHQDGEIARKEKDVADLQVEIQEHDFSCKRARTVLSNIATLLGDKLVA